VDRVPIRYKLLGALAVPLVLLLILVNLEVSGSSRDVNDLRQQAREKDVPWRIHGNVMNNAERPGVRGSGEAGKLITNLPGDGAVEVACMIDRNGVNPTRYGLLPPQMAHICASNMAFIHLAATACIERSKEAAIHALLLDPLTAAVLTPRQIKSMALELFEAEEEFLAGYR
jgi:alpha-galactosidase